MYIYLSYPNTSHHECIGVMHVMVLNYNTTQNDEYFVLSSKPYICIDLLIKGFRLVPRIVGLEHYWSAGGPKPKMTALLLLLRCCCSHFWISGAQPGR